MHYRDRVYPVYSPGPIRGARPLFLVDFLARREYLDNGSAKPVHRGKAIQLLHSSKQFRGVSAQMGPRVTLNAVMGSTFHMAIVEAWAKERDASPR